ncbi:MAG: hypothetical protein HOZ81_10960 [Streptomyces sp.]|nr:hypothetical protein [Streptomyces sp.]NUS24229.1 hypothetical protein [Streptomyces sp.]
MTRRTRLLAALALALLALTACQATYPPGPSGTVTDRSRAYFKSGGWRYWLTVDGTRFRVTRDQYGHCFHGSSYPACTHRGGEGQ